MTAAFLLGFLGSLHCAGMCGPLAMLVHQSGVKEGLSSFWSGAMYHIGRIGMYVVLGSVAGLISMATWGSMQVGFSFLAGVILILAGLRFIPWERKLFNIPGLDRLSAWIPSVYGRWMHRAGRGSALIGGVLNGLLPCGLVYLALSAAFATGAVGLSVQFMAFFGLGTVPMLAGTQMIGARIRQRFTMVRAYILPAFLIIAGGLLILRAIQIKVPDQLQWLYMMMGTPMCE